MIIVSSRTLRENQKKYFDLASKERVIVKLKLEFIELVPRGKTIPDSVSPSNDPYYDDPRNVEELERRIKNIKEGKSKLTRFTDEMQNELFDK